MTKQRAVGYIRQSQERRDRSEASPRAQREGIHAESARRGYEYLADYEDKDLSGYKQGVVRPQFEKLLNDARAGLLDVIIVFYISRFSRLRPEDAIPVVMELHRLGVTIVSVNEGDFPPGDTMKLIMLIFRLDAAHQESVNKSEHVKSAKKILRNAGSWVGGLPPYGFETKEVHENGLTLRKLVIVPEEAAVIQAVVAMILVSLNVPAKAGERHPGSLAGICSDLNEHNVQTKTARLNGKWRGAVTVSTPGRGVPPHWEVTTLKRILLDPRLIGHAVEPIYQRTEMKDGRVRNKITGYRTIRDPETQEPIISHPAILEPADWYKIQAWLTTRGRGKGLSRGSNLLSGLAKLFCEDGFTMASNGGTGSAGSYRCNRPKGSTTVGHAGGNSINRAHVEEHVVRAVFTKITNADDEDPETLAIIAEASRRYAATVTNPQAIAETTDLVVRRADKKAAQEQLYDDLENGIYDGKIGRGRFKERKALLEAEIITIESRLANLAQIETPILPIDQWTNTDDPEGDPLGPGSWWDTATLVDRRSFLCLFIDRIEVAKAASRGNKWMEYDASKRVTIKWASRPPEEPE
ncbi:recombinase family protein [Embleya sp. NPDC005971]|uniref:recombinase family protein n=1 Tax=Embleya sp. NPDC005971 TaxID=3156724 RepID=UPI0033D82078